MTEIPRSDGFDCAALLLCSHTSRRSARSLSRAARATGATIKEVEDARADTVSYKSVSECLELPKWLEKSDLQNLCAQFRIRVSSPW